MNDGLRVGTNDGNLDGTLRGAMVGLEPNREETLIVSSLQTKTSLIMNDDSSEAKVFDPGINARFFKTVR